jgi:hypothetical protein
MSTPYALLRLTWRPWTLLVLPAMALVFAMVFDQGDASLHAIWHGDSSWPVRDALWHLVALGPMALGVLAAIYRLEMQHTTLACTLPGLRRGMLAGMLAIGVPVAAMLALLMGRIAPTSAAIAAFALALFWFLVPGAALDVALPRPARWLAGIAMIGGLLSSGDVGVDYSAEGWVGPLVQAQPVLTSLVALGCAAALLWVQASPALARRRPLLWSALAPSRAQALFWARQQHVRLAWRTSLVTERLGPWLRAAIYESQAFPRAQVALPVIAALLLIALGKPSWLWFFAGLLFTQGGFQLRTNLPYPLSRNQRTTLAYAGTLVHAGLFCVVAGVVLLVLGLVPLADLGLPLFPPDDARAFNSWPTSLGLAFALAPIAQWAVIRWSGVENSRRARRIERLGCLLVYMLACGLAALALSGPTFAGHPRDTAVGVVALAVVVQIVHWFAVRRYFTTRDLVRRSS